LDPKIVSKHFVIAICSFWSAHSGTFDSINLFIFGQCALSLIFLEYLNFIFEIILFYFWLWKLFAYFSLAYFCPSFPIIGYPIIPNLISIAFLCWSFLLVVTHAIIFFFWGKWFAGEEGIHVLCCLSVFFQTIVHWSKSYLFLLLILFILIDLSDCFFWFFWGGLHWIVYCSKILIFFILKYFHALISLLCRRDCCYRKVNSIIKLLQNVQRIIYYSYFEMPM
jgi:hypothetical protein